MVPGLHHVIHCRLVLTHVHCELTELEYASVVGFATGQSLSCDLCNVTLHACHVMLVAESPRTLCMLVLQF
jgi:hypothetical protein